MGLFSQSFFQGMGQGVSDIAGAIGDFAEASAYREAANLATGNVQVAKASGAIQEQQMERQILSVTGSQIAETAGAGFSEGGTTARLMLRSSFQQGALAKQLIATQTVLNENNFREEAAAYNGMASAAQASGVGGVLGGLANIAGSFMIPH